MNKLIIDCSYGMSVNLLTDKEGYSFVDYDQKKHTDNLLVNVDELLKKAGISVNDIGAFCVCVGPGSFTGIRVAVSIIKGLAINSNAKIYTASNFDVLSYGIDEDSYFVIEGFSNFIYVRKIDSGKVYDDCFDLVTFVEEFKNNNISKIYAQNEKVQNMFKKYEISSEIAENNTILCFDKKIQNDECVNLNEINPIYLRASQAEIEREKRLKN